MRRRNDGHATRGIKLIESSNGRGTPVMHRTRFADALSLRDFATIQWDFPNEMRDWLAWRLGTGCSTRHDIFIEIGAKRPVVHPTPHRPPARQPARVGASGSLRPRHPICHG